MTSENESQPVEASRQPLSPKCCKLWRFWRWIIRPLRLRLIGVLTLVAFFASSADAHVTRVEILSRSDIQDGRAFGLAGAYEKIVGRVYFAVNPDNLHNRQIVDIDKAPRKGSRGTTVFFVHPKSTETAAFGYLIEVVQEAAHA